MESQEPTPRRKSRRKPSQPEAERTSKEVEHPPTEKPILKVEEPVPNKYAPKPKVGTPKLGRSPNYVETGVLGKLKVTTAHGTTTNSDV